MENGMWEEGYVQDLTRLWAVGPANFQLKSFFRSLAGWPVAGGDRFSIGYPCLAPLNRRNTREPPNRCQKSGQTIRMFKSIFDDLIFESF